MSATFESTGDRAKEIYMNQDVMQTSRKGGDIIQL